MCAELANKGVNDVLIVEGAPPACGGMPATHSPPRAKASKWRLTRSAGHRSGGAERVVLGDLARLTPR